MPLRDRIATRAAVLFGDMKAAPPTRPPGRLRAASAMTERWDIPDPTLAEPQSNLYANLGWIQIAVSMVSEAVASTPFSVSQRTRSGLSAIEDHPLELLFEQPNPEQDQSEFFEATVSWKRITGNCYWWLNRASETAPPDEIWIIPSNKIQPVPAGDMSVRGYLYNAGYSTPIPLEAWEVLHFKSFNPLNQYVGLSAVQALAIDATGDIAAQRFNANFYGKDNVKGAGILAFAEAIDDPRWNRIASDWSEQHGGTKNNRVMRLRGVGAGGVQWIATQLSQVEIQYLEQRRFTMEEVYARLAPGLASVLAINATEANSTAGKDTFLSMAVYPQTFSIGKKITQKLLPAYGDGLVGAFEDVRRVDTQIELLEQQEYSKTHTIAEVRKKYYQDKPLGDDRDKLLSAEVGSGMTDARNPADKPPPPAPLQFGQQAAAPDALATAQKRLDRERWERKAMKHALAGRPLDLLTFDPDYLSDDEAMPIRAALKAAKSADDVRRVFEEG